ncbi:MAG: protein-ADP-ribose hydrolase [Clostridium sp.]|nr:protein-ADP-ribose hydrolase [Clostridium sp.]
MDYIVKYLRSDSEQYNDIEIPNNNKEKRILIRSFMNIRMPRTISKEFIDIQDEFLLEETKNKGIITLEEILTIKEQFESNVPFAEKISIYQGDITRLKVDAIVNAANSQMLGCFVPCHKCIDNAIHSAAGVQLREECNELMKKQEHEEQTGSAKITKGYNLPCKYVIHTVGPIVKWKLNDELKKDLENCYNSCLEQAVENGIRSIAFCCISTGEFHFPSDEAAKIAVRTVQTFMEKNYEKLDRVIFNVFKDMDLEIYCSLFK